MTFVSLMASLLLEQFCAPCAPATSCNVGLRTVREPARRQFNAGQYRDGVISWVLAVLPLLLLTLT
jgi:hypothetical protein